MVMILMQIYIAQSNPDKISQVAIINFGAQIATLRMRISVYNAIELCYTDILMLCKENH